MSTNTAQTAAQTKEDFTELPPFVGLGGKFQSGKDAFADELVSQYGYHKLGMSDVLADALFELNPYIPTRFQGSELIYDEIRKELDWNGFNPVDPLIRYRVLTGQIGYVRAKRFPEVRRLLQMLGTEVGRNMIHPNVWVDVMMRRAQQLRSQGHPVVITGIRYENELDAVERLGGATVYVWRDRAEAAFIEQHHSTNAHSSEQLRPERFQELLFNNGSLDDLRVSALEFGEKQRDKMLAAHGTYTM